ncbi:MAG: hypothetical protein ACJAZC_002302 [Cryomorphaceae bacterium]|jgi:hypothetical protein
MLKVTILEVILFCSDKEIVKLQAFVSLSAIHIHYKVSVCFPKIMTLLIDLQKNQARR